MKEVSVEVSDASVPAPAPAPVPESAPILAPEVMVREQPKSECEKCKTCLGDSAKCCKCSWSLCLNGVEALCTGLSICCISMSDVALSCNKCLEQMDCDGH